MNFVIENIYASNLFTFMNNKIYSSFPPVLSGLEVYCKLYHVYGVDVLNHHLYYLIMCYVVIHV